MFIYTVKHGILTGIDLKEDESDYKLDRGLHQQTFYQGVPAIVLPEDQAQYAINYASGLTNFTYFEYRYHTFKTPKNPVGFSTGLGVHYISNDVHQFVYFNHRGEAKVGTDFHEFDYVFFPYYLPSKKGWYGKMYTLSKNGHFPYIIKNSSRHNVILMGCRQCNKQWNLEPWAFLEDSGCGT